MRKITLFVSTSVVMSTAFTMLLGESSFAILKRAIETKKQTETYVVASRTDQTQIPYSQNDYEEVLESANPTGIPVVPIAQRKTIKVAQKAEVIPSSDQGVVEQFVQIFSGHENLADVPEKPKKRMKLTQIGR